MPNTSEMCPKRPSTAVVPDGYFLPELPRLLPVAYHPKAAQIEFRSNGWVRRYLKECFDNEEHLLKFLRERVGLYGPLIAPLADEQRVLDLSDFYHFVGFIDNLAVDHTGLGASGQGAREVFDRIMTDFGAGAGSESPFGPAAADLWRRISPRFSAQQVKRFKASLEKFLWGITAELPYQLDGEVPDYDTYIGIRINSFGCDFIVLLTEYAMEIDMSELSTSPEFGEMYAHSMRQMILVNDLLSLRKEHGDPMNAVAVLEHHEGRTLQDAVDRVSELAGHHERAYIAARDTVLSGSYGDRDDVRAYCDGLDHMLAGAQEFEYLTPRYYGDGFVWDGSTSGWLSLTSAIARLRS